MLCFAYPFTAILPVTLGTADLLLQFQDQREVYDGDTLGRDE